MKNSLIPMTANEQPHVAYPPMPTSCAALGKKIFGYNSALKRAFMDAQTETRDA